MVPDNDDFNDIDLSDVGNLSPGAGKASGGSSASNIKVELDIDDAPFLQEPEEPKKPAPKLEVPQPKAEAASEADAKPGLLKRLFPTRKRLIIVIAALFVLGVVPPVVGLLFFGKKAPVAAVAEPERVVVPNELPREDAPDGPKHLYKAQQFIVEKRGSEGELRFLRCSFAVPTDDQILFSELSVKNIAIRDAVYYYLNNKPLTFLSDKNITDVLKKDLISVINELLSSGKISDLLLEEYLVLAM